mgnify:FL=1
MPLEILINFKDKPSEVHYIAIPLMRGEKQNPYKTKWTVHKDWPWAHPEYELIIDHPKSKIKDIFIDPSYYMADTDRDNNSYFNQPW